MSFVPISANFGARWQMLNVLHRVVLCSTVLWVQVQLVVESIPWGAMKSHSPPADAPLTSISIKTMFNVMALNVKIHSAAICRGKLNWNKISHMKDLILLLSDILYTD